MNVFPLHLPPLRERAEDVPAFVHYFVARYAAKIGRRIDRLDRDTLRRLVAYDWPGNVRELENVVERAVILSPGPELLIAPELLPTPSPGPDAPPAGAPAGDSISLELVERQHIVAVLKQTGWRIEGTQGAARILEMNPSTLRSRMKKLGIQRRIEGES